ncbi:UDP-2,3-diacylglucosamine diphosphatase [Undibacterium sp. SXout11W]|uniref:UDP-2,3-diacylglucosamine diphosphatase n=1 Tax=Undibacterium sp. SXout11W TaxID=3413050 RepID=UPI003BF31462
MKNSEKQTTAQPKSVALFVSDIHLSPSLPKTTRAFLSFLAEQGTRTKQLYILGDMFEYWVGDDDIYDKYNAKIVQTLRSLTAAGIQLFWIAGNRDFLIGEDFAIATGMQLLKDPSIITVAGKKIAICHGDEQCTDDTAYMQFRAQVRNIEWQRNFLTLPLAQRKTIVSGMRESSKMQQSQNELSIMDVNPTAIEQLFASSACHYLIHGHTHRPALHEHDGQYRYVLPDWDCDEENPRGGWISIDEHGEINRISFTNGGTTSSR